MTYASVEDWLNEIESYSLRSERLTLNEADCARIAWNLATEHCVAETAELKRQLAGYKKHLDACEQIAGKALGYPWYKDDQKNSPGATDADGVCIGEHVGDTVVAELAKRYEKTRNALENVVIAYGMGWDMDGVIGVAEEVLGLKKENASL